MKDCNLLKNPFFHGALVLLHGMGSPRARFMRTMFGAGTLLMSKLEDGYTKSEAFNRDILMNCNF